MRRALALLLFAAVPVGAAELLVEPTPAATAELVARIRPFLADAPLPDGSPVPPETPEELAGELIPAGLAQRVVRRGALTGEMQASGLDWAEESFLPFMTALRTRGGYTPRQLAFVGMLHGGAQEMVVGALSEAKVTGCSKGRIKALRKIRDGF